MQNVARAVARQARGFASTARKGSDALMVVSDRSFGAARCGLGTDQRWTPLAAPQLVVQQPRDPVQALGREPKSRRDHHRKVPAPVQEGRRHSLARGRAEAEQGVDQHLGHEPRRRGARDAPDVGVRGRVVLHHVSRRFRGVHEKLSADSSSSRQVQPVRCDSALLLLR